MGTLTIHAWRSRRRARARRLRVRAELGVLLAAAALALAGPALADVFSNVKFWDGDSWENATATVLGGNYGGGGLTIGRKGTQTISATCAEVPSAGATAGRLYIAIQNVSATITVRCGFNSDCTAPQLNIDPGNASAKLPTGTSAYCDTASGEAGIGFVEYLPP